ncbi:MAG: CHRD domain-containing protein [Gemmatimonadaceae bacterium]
MRSRLLVPVFALALIGAGTSCDDEVTGIQDIGEAFQEDATWEATLSGANESPPVTTPATGRAWFVDRGNTIDFYIEYSGLTSNTTNAHIHRTSTTGVMVQLPFVTGATSGTVVGTIDMTRLSGGVNDVAPLETGNQSAADFRTLLNNGGAYVNIHSLNNTGGEIRGTINPR